ncbi:hypothetical protein HU200_025952 [Digitaria exilis]|uniref:Uncharacterized protein n=1 Tax=Digitaria exilis TaxID=1010633 RepID=A0A835BVU3_9POAL|nr:hypothetical protein HU200_025952 [Digitaria exilis]
MPQSKQISYVMVITLYQCTFLKPEHSLLHAGSACLVNHSEVLYLQAKAIYMHLLCKCLTFLLCYKSR